MEYAKQTQFISSIRLNRYEQACNGKSARAIGLYQANIFLSQSFYPLLALFEIAFRNAVDEVLAKYLNDPSWLQSQAMGPHFSSRQGGNALNKVPAFIARDRVQKTIRKILREGKPLTHSRIVSGSTLGFWTELFDKRHYRILKGQVIQVFPYRPKGIKRNHIYDRLTQIRLLRNRIAHHEPICFFPGSSQIDLQNAQLTSQAMLDLPKWMDQDLNTWGQCIDQVTPELKKLQSEFVFKHVS